jgi:hypothetical protein
MKRMSAAVTAALLVAAGGLVGSVPATAAEGGAGYLQPTTSITPAKGCHRLSRGMNGVKVKLVQRRLGMGSRWETVDDATMSRVRQFQRRHGLRATGVVNRPTWKAMGFKRGFCIDGWQAEPALRQAAGPRRRINVMLDFAMSYRGAEYVWGGAGGRKLGVDCSGLALQAMYRAGLDPQPISVDRHVRPHYRTSQALFRHDRLRHVPLRNRRRGDLIFYRNGSTGDINHVALFLGRGRGIVQAKGSRVHVDRFRRSYDNQPVAKTVVRPFH